MIFRQNLLRGYGRGFAQFFTLLFLWVPWLVAAHAQSTPSWNLYDNYTNSYTIPYTHPPNYLNGKTGLYVSASVDGSAPLTYQVDTGSQGMVIPQYLIPGFVQAPLADQQKILYASSGNYSIGTWATETITFPGSHDANGQVATATVPVLVESKSVSGNITTDCSKQGAPCTTLMGIGYGRPDDGWGPDYLPSLVNNPLLNITGMAQGTVRAGYVITPEGIEAGLTAANAGSGYAYTQLVPTTAPVEDSPNWQTLPGSVVVNGSTVQSGKGVLIDAGISYAWADLGSTIAANAVPCGSGDGFTCAPPGTEVTVYLGASGSVGFSYTVGAVDNSTAAPEFLRVNGGAAMNTGIHPLSVFNYVFDAAGGFVGLQEIAPGTAGVAFAPGISIAGNLALPDGFSTNLPVYVSIGSTILPTVSASFLGDFSGPGALTIGGPGTFLLSGNANLPAGIAVTGGNAVVAGHTDAAVAVSAGAGVTNTGTIEGDITNAGALVNAGAIDGNVTNTDVFINTGTLSGTLTDAGVFSGSGTVGAVYVSAGGVIAPGASGLVKVSGNVTFQPGSTYLAVLGAQGTSSLVSAQGTAIIDGGTLVLTPGQGFSPTLGAQYTLLIAASGVQGNFTVADTSLNLGTPASALPFLGVNLSNTGTAEEVTLTRSAVPFAALMQTPNQIDAATAADSLSAAAPLSSTLISLTGSEAPAAFTALSGEIYASVQNVLLSQLSYVRDAVYGRLAQVTGGAPAGDAGIQSAPLTGTKAVLWEQTYGGWERQHGNADIAPVTNSIGGFMIGLDQEIDVWRVGTLAGFGQSAFSANEISSTGTSNNYDFAIYAGRSFSGFGPGSWALRFGSAYSYHALTVQRSVALPGYQATYRPGYSAQTGQIFGEIAYGLSIRPENIRIEPFAGVSYASLTTASFSEGSGSAALAVSGNTIGSPESTLGVRGSGPVSLGTLPLIVSGSLGWQHDYGHLTSSTRLVFAAGSLLFTAYGVPLASNSLLTGVSISGRLRSAGISLTYSGQIAPAANNVNALNGAVTWSF